MVFFPLSGVLRGFSVAAYGARLTANPCAVLAQRKKSSFLRIGHLTVPSHDRGWALRRKTWAHSSLPPYLKFLVYLVVVVLNNVAGATLFYRVDLTENKAYSLSDASRRVVSNLSEPLTIKVFFQQ